MVRLTHPLVATAFVVLVSARALTQSAPPPERAPRDIVIGTSIVMPSKVFGAPVQLDIALPSGYEAGTARYPVLIAFQCHFAAVSGLVGTLATAGVVPPMIVVSARYDPTWFALYAKEGRSGSGRADAVLQSIRHELVPLVDTRYRTVPYRVFLGHSSSALFLLHGMLAAPDLMRGVLSAGPMFAEFDYGRVAAMLEQALAARPERTQFLFYTQGSQPELTKDLAAFGSWLGSRRPRGLTWSFDAEPEANHGSLHLKTLYDGLRILFADWSTLPEDVAVRGGDAIRAYRKGLADRFGYEIGLGRMADWHLKVKWGAEKKYDAVIALATFNRDERPEDFEAEWHVATAYENAGRWADAAAGWERCLAKARQHDSPEAFARLQPILEARLAAVRKRMGK